MTDTTKRPISALLFANGCIAAFDADGEQIGELQESPISLWAERATELGWDVEGLVIDVQGKCRWRLFRTPEGKWNRVMIERRAE